MCGHSTPFGLKSAPKIFTAVADELQFIYQQHYGWQMLNWILARGQHVNSFFKSFHVNV